MEISEIKINQNIKATMQDGTVKDGIVKGIAEDKLGNVNVTVEYLTTARQEFAINKVQAV